jgi:UDP-2,3-diacylglucosamine pyrophosphatase LpxH
MRSQIYWPQSHSNVVRRILTYTRRGTEVIYVTGNHDEFLRRYSDIVIGNLHLVDRAEHRMMDGRRLLVVHGDEFDVITRYHRWIAGLGDVGYTLLLEINRHLNRVRSHLGYGYWSLAAWAKRRVKHAVNFIGDFEQAMVHHCRKEGYAGVICGHIHHAEIRDVDGIGYMNCGDWVESCTALVEDANGRFSILDWSREQPETDNVVPLESGRMRA